MTTRSLSYTRTRFPPAGSGTAGPDSPGSPVGTSRLPGIEAISARAEGENFPVASRLLPASERAAIMDVYRYARFVDELGDSYEGDRLEALDWFESQVRHGLAGDPRVHAVVAGAARLVRQGRIGSDPLFDLIAANRMDQEVDHYETFEDLLGYCRLSANPVGRLVLELFSASTPERLEWSDLICTALQLAEHWQDVAEDARVGRVYLPAEDLRSYSVRLSELTSGRPATPSLQAMMSFETQRARDLLNGGAPLIASVGGRLRVAIAGFWAGGHAALDAIERREFDPISRQARPARTHVCWHLVRALIAPKRFSVAETGR